MSFLFTKTGLGVTWLFALAAAVWMAIGTASVAAWLAVIFLAGLPVVTLMVDAQTPAKSVAEIIRDAEAGRAL
jgi:hypothetical protein